MRKILIAVDGSKQAEATAAYVAARAAPGSAEIHLVNVQRPLSAYAARFLSRGTRRDFHRDEGRLALASAELTLKRSGHRPLSHIHVGDGGSTIARVGNMLGVDEIVIGANALGLLDRLMFRAFMARLMERAEALVVVVKSANPSPHNDTAARRGTYPPAALAKAWRPGANPHAILRSLIAAGRVPPLAGVRFSATRRNSERPR